MVVCHASTNAARDLDGLPAFAVCDDLIADDMPVCAHRLRQAAVGAVNSAVIGLAVLVGEGGVHCGGHADFGDAHGDWPSLPRWLLSRS